MKASFQIAECNLSYAKLVKKGVIPFVDKKNLTYFYLRVGSW